MLQKASGRSRKSSPSRRTIQMSPDEQSSEKPRSTGPETSISLFRAMLARLVKECPEEALGVLTGILDELNVRKNALGVRQSCLQHGLYCLLHDCNCQ